MARLLVLAAVSWSLFLPAPAQARRSEAEKLMQRLAHSRDAGERAEAAWELGEIGAAEAASVLAAALSDRSQAVRSNAAASLWKLDEAARPAMPELWQALRDPYYKVISNAAGALANLGVPKGELARAYRRLVAMDSCAARVRGLRGLVGEVPPEELLPDTVACFQDRDPEASSDAREVLGQLLERRSPAMASAILEELSHSGPGYKDVTPLVLAVPEFAPPLAEAVPILEQLLSSRNDETRRWSAVALGRMGRTALASAASLIRILEEDSEPPVREAAAKAIGDLGQDAAAAVPALAKAAAEDGWPSVREASLDALGEMRERARTAIPVLEEALEDPDASIRISARNALFRVDPDHKEEHARAADEVAAAAVPSRLFEDATALPAAFAGKGRDAVELVIYADFAIATVPDASGPTDYARYTYRAGAVTGPESTSVTCEETFRWKEVDFEVVPKLVRQAPGLLGAEGAPISHVTLSAGVFCDKVGWSVYVGEGMKSAGYVVFRLDGKKKNVQRF